MRDGTLTEIENPSKLPDLSKIEEIREPIITATILLPQEYVGPVMTLCNNKRGAQKNMPVHGPGIRRAIMPQELQGPRPFDRATPAFEEVEVAGLARFFWGINPALKRFASPAILCILWRSRRLQAARR